MLSKTKTTTRLFKGIYQYKIVLICAGARWFRNGDMTSTLEQLSNITLKENTTAGNSFYNATPNGRTTIKTKEELDYAFKLCKQIKKIKDIDIRVEGAWISVYTNLKSDIDALIKLNPDNVKYISVPPADTTLSSDTIIMPKINYDFRITLGKTTQNYDSFIQWAESNKKVKLTKSCKKDLSRDRSWGGTHFYITGDNNLLMAKMHLGGCIGKVQRIIK